MEKVVRLADYRHRREARRPRPAANETVPHYYCQRCDTDRFKLYQSGAVHCASCGALIRNIVVTPSPSAKEQS
ncbi:MAG TPA: hypothetical protein VHL85_00490 [Burkholderiales bacterium]|jgi:ribosomal protein L37AE/L43A|nr:hypothetical protein [Burkholderiales bacterium]